MTTPQRQVKSNMTKSMGATFFDRRYNKRYVVQMFLSTTSCLARNYEQREKVMSSIFRSIAGNSDVSNHFFVSAIALVSFKRRRLVRPVSIFRNLDGEIRD